MKKLILGAVALALLSAPAFAQNYNRDRRESGRDNGPRSEQRNDNDRSDRGRDTFRPGDSFHAGGTIPYQFRVGGHYAFYDWRGAGLKAPRAPYHWFKIGDQYLLADQHTGKIIDVREVGRSRLSFVEGGIVPYEYRVGGKYIYYDWYRAGLKRPPRGFEWMLIGDSLVLADQQNGTIAEVRPERGNYRR